MDSHEPVWTLATSNCPMPAASRGLQRGVGVVTEGEPGPGMVGTPESETIRDNNTSPGRKPRDDVAEHAARGEPHVQQDQWRIALAVDAQVQVAVASAEEPAARSLRFEHPDPFRR